MPNTTITCGDGFELGAYEASPSGAAKGAVVVIQEIFGVNSHIRSVVDSYAEAGFYAIAPAIFDRLERDVQLGYTEDDMTAGIELAFQKLDMSQTLGDLQATIGAAANHGKVGVVGYCFGGLLTWLSSCNLNQVSGQQRRLRSAWKKNSRAWSLRMGLTGLSSRWRLWNSGADWIAWARSISTPSMNSMNWKSGTTS